MFEIPKTMHAGVDCEPEKLRKLPIAVFLSRHGDKILALVPLAFLIWVVTQYAVAVPFLDQWELVPLLEKTYHGDLTLHDLWAQNNEHRLVFPKIIMLLLARLTHWNIHYELAVNLILALGIFTVLIYQVKITGRKLGMAGLHWAIPAISLIVFSISQYQNWLWGWQLQMLLNMLTAVGGILLLADETFSWRRFAAAALLGMVATYSFANGTLFWPIGLVILFVATAGKRQRPPAMITWLAVSVLILWSYLYHYQKPEEHPPLNLIFKMPFEYASFVLKYIGGICAQCVGGSTSTDCNFALVFGLAAILAMGWAGWMLVRKKVADFKTLLPYFGISLYSIGSALMTGVGRVGFGSNQAMYSRYCTTVVPLWVSLVVFLILLRTGSDRTMNADPALKNRYERSAPLDCRQVSGWLLLTAITMLVLGSVCATDGAKTLSRIQTVGRKSLLNLAANPASETDYRGLRFIYPRPKVIVERYPILMKYRLSVFRDREIPLDSP
ncbi:MAG: hypothetical protein ABSH11_07205 [Verrucomicrobiota bacterium]